MNTVNVYKRKAARRPGRFAVLAAAALLLAAALLIIVLELCIRRPVMTLARERGRALAADTMSFAVLAALEEEQGDMLTVSERGGESYLVLADTAKINRVASLASADARQRMAAIGSEGIPIALGDICGVLTSGRGPKLDVRFTPVGSVTAETVSSLRSSGINQSVYSVDLILTAHLQLVLGGRAEVIEVRGVSPICQTVIVGAVPQVYTNVANEDDMLNLIPNEAPEP